jgi:hypothetical protein
VTNTSVNPARSAGPALFVGGLAVKQLWLFFVAPLAGALLAGAAHRFPPDCEGVTRTKSCPGADGYTLIARGDEP